MGTVLAPQLEMVTPRIDSVVEAGCRYVLVWDEVLGWLHLATGVLCRDLDRLARIDAPLPREQVPAAGPLVDPADNQETRCV
jgi:hypothetical protein